MLRYIEDGSAIERHDIDPDGEMARITVTRIAPADEGWESAVAILGADLPDLPPAPTPEDLLARAKAEALAIILSRSRKVRALFLTDLPGQEMIYTAKREEAERLLLDPAAAPEDYPFLAAEIGVTGIDLEDVGRTIRGLASSWLQIGPVMEALRVSANVQVRSAASVDQVDLAIAAFSAGMQQIEATP